MDIMISFDVVHKFIDADGNTYMTDQWNEEDVDVDVDDMETDTIVTEVISSAQCHARHLIIECKLYDYIDIELDEDGDGTFETIQGLRLVESIITRMRYDDDNNARYDIEIPGERIVKC